jgi:hypothetical protein
LNELEGRGCVHRDNDPAAQEDSPEASDPFSAVWTPKKDTIPGQNAPPVKHRTPEKGGGVKLCIRQLFPTIAASLDDSNVAAEAGEVSKKAQKILSGHKRSGFFASDMGRFYP